MQSLQSQNLVVLGAAYGLANVTDLVRSRINHNSLQFTADNNTFGDTWAGVKKSFVLVYQYGNSKPTTVIAPEGSNINISHHSGHHNQWTSHTAPGQLSILGAAYGLADVTGSVQSKVQNNVINFTSDNQALGEGWSGVQKSFVVVYEHMHCRPQVFIGQENGQVHIGPQLSIIKAAYGLKDVFQIIRDLVTKSGGGRLDITVDNNILSDGWPGVKKMLVVFYQYGYSLIQSAFRMEGEHLVIDYQGPTQQIYQPPTNPNELEILGAVYGKGDVTAKCRGSIMGGHTNIQASNGVFGDTWPGDKKALVIVYRHGYEEPKLAVLEENQSIQL